MPNQSGRIILVLLVVVLLSGSLIYYFVYSKQLTSVLPQGASQEFQEKDLSKNYSSKNLKISITVPSTSRIEEKFTDINIYLEEGEIQVTRIGTNFSNAKEYFEDLKIKNKLSPRLYEAKLINGNDAVLVAWANPNNESEERTYFIYKDGWVFTFSSQGSSNIILDEVVHSFEYLP